MRLSSFFKTPSSWSRDYDALDKKGKPYNLNEYKTEDFKNGNRIESLSLQGAVAYLLPYEQNSEYRAKTCDKLRKAIYRHTGKNYTVAQFNRLRTTTFEDIKTVVKLAENL